MIKQGEVAWSDLDFTNRKAAREAKKAENKNKYVKLLQNTENQLRIITEAHEYLVHSKWMPVGENIDPQKVQKWGYSIKCSGVGGQRCPLCESGHKANRQWYVGVINRTDPENVRAQILDAKKSIISKVKDFTKSKAYGHPSQYDILITANPGADPKDYYSVIPMPAIPLTAEDLKMKQSFDVDELKKMTALPTPEDVQTSIEKIISFLTSPPKDKVTSTPTPNAKVSESSTTPASAEGDKDDFTFLDADQDATSN